MSKNHAQHIDILILNDLKGCKPKVKEDRTKKKETLKTII